MDRGENTSLKKFQFGTKIRYQTTSGESELKVTLLISVYRSSFFTVKRFSSAYHFYPLSPLFCEAVNLLLTLLKNISAQNFLK